MKADKLKSMARHGRLAPTDRVKRGDWNDWIMADSVLSFAPVDRPRRGANRLLVQVATVFGCLCLFFTFPVIEGPFFLAVLPPLRDLWYPKSWLYPFCVALVFLTVHAVAFYTFLLMLRADKSSGGLTDPAVFLAVLRGCLVAVYYPLMMVAGLVFLARALILAAL
jgi:hypothetical protein